MRYAAFSTLFVIISFLALFSCENNDFGSSSSSQSTSPVEPIGHGRGTQTHPLTPDELISGQRPQTMAECWVMGYAVGSTYSSMRNALFEVPTAYSSNILLASDSLCTDYDQCIAVALTTNAMKNQFSLMYNEDRFRQFVVLCGTYGTYFSRYGLVRVDDGYWIPGFDLSTIVIPPQEWDTLVYNP